MTESNPGERAERPTAEHGARLGSVVASAADASATDAIVSLDEAFRVVLFSQSAEELFGVSAAEALGRDFGSFIALGQRSRQLQQISEFARSTQRSCRLGDQRDLFGLRQPDLEFPLEGGMCRCDSRDGRLLTLMLRASGERSRAEDEGVRLSSQVQRTQKLESLGVLAGGIAHDFNNLLMAVLGHADLALDSLPASSEARGDLVEIRRAAQRATELCKQMLAYSGKGRFVIQPIELQQVVDDMLHMLRASVSKNVVLTLNLAAHVPCVEADASQLRQAILNLIVNASEAIAESPGEIALATGVMDCDRAYLAECWLDEQLPEGPYVFIEVADTGVGMDAQVRGRIFDPFFTTKFTGRGLGLSVVLGIVRGHRGAIKVDSELGSGTTFTLLFPVSQRAAAREQDGALAARYSGKGAVLLADDDESVREVGRRMLERLGFSVIAAADGAEAIARFREHADDIVCAIVDLTMPRADGVETFSELRRVRPGLRVILASGHSEHDATERFVGQGLAGFLQKPYQLSTLLAVLQKVLENGRE